MKTTLSIIKADVGSIGGQLDDRPGSSAEGRGKLRVVRGCLFEQGAGGLRSFAGVVEGEEVGEDVGVQGHR